MHAPAALALALLPLLAAALDANCAPASCGNLSIRYPLWLRSHQPPYCGYPSFGIACDDATGAPPVLDGSNLRVLDIHYGNSSVVAFYAGLADYSTGGCRATRFNVSATLALSSLLAVSRANRELLFSSNCSPMPPPARGRCYAQGCNEAGKEAEEGAGRQKAGRPRRWESVRKG